MSLSKQVVVETSFYVYKVGPHYFQFLKEADVYISELASNHGISKFKIEKIPIEKISYYRIEEICEKTGMRVIYTENCDPIDAKCE